MRKLTNILITGALSILQFFGLVAQDHRLQIGITGGLTNSRLWGGEAYRYSSPINGNIGGCFVQFKYRNYLHFRTDILFEEKGGQYIENYFGQTGLINQIAIQHGLNYLVIPCLTRLSIGNKTKLFIQGGPYFAVLLKANLHTKYLNGLQTYLDETSSYKRLDFGFSCGLGLSRAFSEVTIGLEFRNNVNLINTYHFQDKEFYTRNLSFNAMIYLAFQFPWIGKCSYHNKSGKDKTLLISR
jgi:hypothetical protein